MVLRSDGEENRTEGMLIRCTWGQSRFNKNISFKRHNGVLLEYWEADPLFCTGSLFCTALPRPPGGLLGPPLPGPQGRAQARGVPGGVRAGTSVCKGPAGNSPCELLTSLRGCPEKPWPWSASRQRPRASDTSRSALGFSHRGPASGCSRTEKAAHGTRS